MALPGCSPWLRSQGDSGTLHPMMAYLDFRCWAGALGCAFVFTGCADDAPAGPSETGTGSTGGAMTSGSAQDSTESSGDATTSAADVDPDTTVGLDTTDTSTGDAATDSSDSSTGTTGPGNLPPTAHHDPYAILLGTAELVVDASDGVLANDLDPEDDALTVTDFEASSVQGGTVTVEADGAFTYTAPLDYWGEDSFGYTIDDGEGNTAEGVVNLAIAPTTIELGEPGGGHYGFRIDGSAASQLAGNRVANAGDVDGDGLADILVASTEGAAGVGRVWVVFGKDDGTTVDLADVEGGVGGFVITGDTIGEEFATAVAGGGDFNGDGLADIVIGAPGAGNGGEAYLVYGKADGAEVTMAELDLSQGGFLLTGQVVGDEAGTAVAMVGDVNGDGYDDIAVGAPDAGTVPGAGRTFVVHGTTETEAITLSSVLGGMGGFSVNGIGIDDASGSTLGGGGDVNGDGLSDVVIGAPLANPNGGNSGAAYVVFGKTDGGAVNLANAGAAAFSIRGIAASDLAGGAVDIAGDVNGDGRMDVIVGASGGEDDLLFQGQAYVVFGKDDGTDIELSEVLAGMGGFGIDGETAGNFLGQAVAGVGDVDGDGFGDMLLGSPNLDFNGTNAGRAHLIFGKTNGARVETTDISTGLGGFSLDGEANVDRAGSVVAGGGDIDGDGYPDFIIGADGSDIAGNEAGSVYVMFGAGWTGRVGYVGGPADDTFVGAPANEGMVAGQSADTLRGGGGSDVLYGGAGPDTFEIPLGQFFRIDGGSGPDTVSIPGLDVVLNLGVIVNNAMVDIEVVDITGEGNNEVILLDEDVRAMVGANNLLQIVGDKGDTADIDLSGGTWAADGAAGGFDRYTNGVVTLEVSTEIDATVTL